jgi:hypothetical protein
VGPSKTPQPTRQPVQDAPSLQAAIYSTAEDSIEPASPLSNQPPRSQCSLPLALPRCCRPPTHLTPSACPVPPPNPTQPNPSSHQAALQLTLTLTGPARSRFRSPPTHEPLSLPTVQPYPTLPYPTLSSTHRHVTPSAQPTPSRCSFPTCKPSQAHISTAAKPFLLVHQVRNLTGPSSIPTDSPRDSPVTAADPPAQPRTYCTRPPTAAPKASSPSRQPSHPGSPRCRTLRNLISFLAAEVFPNYSSHPRGSHSHCRSPVTGHCVGLV